MANSNIVTEIKDNIVLELINDDNIVNGLDLSYEYETVDELINKSIFRYNKNPLTITESITFITVQVNIPNVSKENAFSYPTVVIEIFSHHSHMKITNIPKVTDVRNDYLSKLIDKKLNGKNLGGICELSLITNIEGESENPDFVRRTLIFKGMDLNNSVCNQE